MFDSSIHLAPNAPWLPLVLATLALAALGVWAYRFAAPPLPALARRVLPALRVIALVVLVWLLAQPILERAERGGARVAVLLDRSRSMDLPVRPGGPTRAQRADRVVADLERVLRRHAAVEVMPFATRLGADSLGPGGRGGTALGDALTTLAQAPPGRGASGVVVVSDGAVNAGEDPVAAARLLGVPVHAVLVGDLDLRDRVVSGVESASQAQVGHPTPVQVRVSSTEERGTPLRVTLLDHERELARATVIAPGPGREVTAVLNATPLRPGLAVWTAKVDSLPGEVSAINNAREIALQVTPGTLGVLILSGGLNWDLGFFRRALLGDSALSLTSWVRWRGGWRRLEGGGAQGLSPDALRGQTVVVLDAIAPAELPGAFDQALAEFAGRGGAVIAFGGPLPGLMRYRAGRLGAELAPEFDPRQPLPATAAPQPAAEARELLTWDDDPARDEAAWRAAAPLADLAPVVPGAGDRVLVRSQGIGPPLLLARRIGRGQALLVNGTGWWRWSLSGHDDLSAERGRRLWRGLVHWLAEPVQAEPLRVRPERWLTAGGEPVRLFATLQDAAFHPLAGAAVEAEVQGAEGGSRRVEFTAAAAGSYVATLEDPPPGRYRVSARARRGGAEVGRATTEFAVDSWSLEAARTLPDSATLADVARDSGGRMTHADDVARWAGGLDLRALSRPRTKSVRLWESPWLFGLVVGALGLEWAWRRRRGLP